VTPRRFTEAELVERPALELLAELSWTVVDAYGETLGPAGTLGRDSVHDVILSHRLRDAIRSLNPDLPDLIREEALAAITKDRSVMDPTRANREVHALLRDGYRAEWRDDRGEPSFATVRYLDFNDSTKNDWLAASQVWIAGELHRRRADTILFVNGIPLVLAEFKEIARPVKVPTRTCATTATPSPSCSPRTASSSSPTARRRRSAPPTPRGTSSGTGRSSTPTALGASWSSRPLSAAPALTTGSSTWSRTSWPTSSGLEAL